MKRFFHHAMPACALLALMATTAAADEVSALKAQIEALHKRVASIEASSATLPANASVLTFERGRSGAIGGTIANDHALDIAPATRGMTISITPAADLPAPVAAIELSGHVRAVALWRDKTRKAKLDDFTLQARGQIDLRATTDTAVGRVEGGMQLRGDFTEPGIGETDLKIRTAWATWHMTENLSFTFGQLAQIATLDNVQSGLLDADLPFGPDNSRRPQFRLTYANGPVNFRFGIEDSSEGYIGTSRFTTMPDFAASLGIDMGVVGFRVGGEVGKLGLTSKFVTAWLVNAGIDFELAERATFSIGGVYTKGLAGDGLLNGGISCCNGTPEEAVKAWGANANLGLKLTETVSTNISAGYVKGKNVNSATAYKEGYNVGANLVYRPVEALQFAVEGYYAKRKFVNDSPADKDLHIGFASWYFF